MKRISGAYRWSIVWGTLAVACAATPPALSQQRRTVSTPPLPRAAATETGEPHWIWAPDEEPGNAKPGTCYFRKVFQLQSPEQGQIVITCDDAYELYVNGRRVGIGRDWKKVDRYDITRYLAAGRNCIAVRAENTSGSSAGLVARVTVRQTGNTDVAYSTDARWKVSRREFANWFRVGLDDRSWPYARSLGEYGRTPPWGTHVKTPEGASAGRFKIDPSFHVERVAAPDKTGSVIAMAFNEWGHILFSVEQGGLNLLQDANSDGSYETLTAYCDQVKNCQGLLPLNGQVFVCGDGPEGPGLYRLSDEDRDHAADQIELLFAFEKPIGEHGPHAIRLGPDGLLYILVGNHGAASKEPSPTSPYRHIYEGDLVQPRYEDPAGHGAGVKAPGGMVLRTDPEGSVVEIFAGGLRNAYDMCFNEQGELFTADSDMESDDGLPWYRPTRLIHLVPGGEYGWRSGWAIWPDYYPDCLPTTLALGRGSPTGMALYQHYRYPESLHNRIFLGDWTRGRILAVRTKTAGGTYEAEAEVFLEGQPLNVTDLAVGPDGWLYFCTGGRGTEGGIYRVVYDGRSPAPPRQSGIAKALQQPQIESAWGREQLAIVKDEMGLQWARQLNTLLASPSGTTEQHLRALDIMQLLGPYPAPETLIRLSASPQSALRAKAAYLMGLHVTTETNERLTELLHDSDPLVRRTACEAIVRAEYQPPVARLLPLLYDKHRHVAYAARLALATLPPDDWKSLVLAHSRPAVFTHGGIALMTAHPDKETAAAVLERSSQLLRNYLTDEEFLNLLRLMQLALLRGPLTGADVPVLSQQLGEEYPALDDRMNRELVRLLVYLDEPGVTSRFIDELSGKAPQPEKLHLAMHLRFLKTGWNSDQKLAYLEFCEQARSGKGGAGVSRYLEAAVRDFAATLSPDEQRYVLADATRFPTAALPALVRLPADLSDEMVQQLQRLDGQLEPIDTDAARQLRTAILAILARTRRPEAFDYLRAQFATQPARRAELAMCLAQEPGGENWPLLVQSLPVLEGAAIEDVLGALAKVPLAPEGPEPLRQVILCGLRGGDTGGALAVSLLEYWTGKQLESSGEGTQASLAAWQEWFRNEYPDQPDPALPEEPSDTKWSLAELVTYLNSPEGKAGRPEYGAEVFEKAQCSKCHRFGQRGEAIGPDLTTISRRFQKKEVLESVLFPSHVISDQYASHTVVTKDGLTYTGLVGRQGEESLVVLQSNGKKVVVPRDDVEEIAPHKKSAMPEGLFNTLTLEEIADLFAYLYSGDAALRSADRSTGSRQ